MTAQAAPPRRQWSLPRYFDVFVVVLSIGITLYLAFRRPVPLAAEWVVGRRMQVLVYGTICSLLLAFLALAQRRGRLAMVSRIGAYLLLVVGVLATWSRVVYRVGYENFPPDPGLSMSGQFGHLSPALRARWGAIVAAHRFATTLSFDASMKTLVGSSAPTALTIPTTWLFPPDVSIATQRTSGDTLWIWARTSDGALDCASFPERQKDPLCDKEGVASAALTFVTPARVQELTPTDARELVGAPWPQYRRDAAKHATMEAGVAGAPWRWRSGSQYRSSASAVGAYVLVGSHGAGDIAAIDLATGLPVWRSRTANWIHQDIVSDGRIAVVGFGDNFHSTWGRAPSGVTAYSVKTGKHLWTHFDEASVMTSPLIYGETIVYGTNSGIIRQRLLATGDLLASARIAGGGVTMAPPSMVGDTAIFTADIEQVCAMQLPGLGTLWCQKMKGARLAGHSAAAVGNGLVVGSNPVSMKAIRFADWWHLPIAHLAKVIWSQIWIPGEDVGHQIYALDLHTGAMAWRSRIFSTTRDVTGHHSGTPTLTDSIGVVVLSTSDTLVAFRIADGSVRWTAGAHKARGPVTIIDDKVIVAGGDGVTEVHDLYSGNVTCTMRRAVGYDRAGPAHVGDMLIFADLKGLVESVPVSALMTCDSERLAEPSTASSPSTPEQKTTSGPPHGSH